MQTLPLAEPTHKVRWGGNAVKENSKNAANGSMDATVKSLVSKIGAHSGSINGNGDLDALYFAMKDIFGKEVSGWKTVAFNKGPLKFTQKNFIFKHNGQTVTIEQRSNKEDGTQFNFYFKDHTIYREEYEHSTKGMPPSQFREILGETLKKLEGK